MMPREGFLTFEAEGTEGGRFHSRHLHVPSGSSGLTLGRGYDMRFRSANNVRFDLVAAGVDATMAELIAKGVGLVGKSAEAFIQRNGLADFEISREAQLKLFKKAYREEEFEARRLCTKADVTDRYGVCDWENLDPAMREVIVDLKFRGDYTPAARARLQESIVENDLDGFLERIGDRSAWPLVPVDRFQRRVRFLQERRDAVATQ